LVGFFLRYPVHSRPFLPIALDGAAISPGMPHTQDPAYQRFIHLRAGWFGHGARVTIFPQGHIHAI
jgi:hypothetical protein